MGRLPDGTIASLGEALIDLVETHDDEPRLARPGGSPYNVAIGLARLGRPTAFLGRISHDPLGTVLRRHAERSGVDLSLSVDAHETTTVALVELTDGVAQYRFGVEGTADFRWTETELAAIPTDLAVLHFGSLTSWQPPGDAAVVERVAALREHMFISYDPNARPLLQRDPASALTKIEPAIAIAHVVKTSDEDLAWLHPGVDPAEIARDWLTRGPGLVVVTRGAAGATAFTNGRMVERTVRPTQMVDTVGAGDAFTSGMLDSLAEHSLITPDAVAAASDRHLEAVLDHAGLVAAITCSRAGANPPRRAELA